MSNIPTPDPGIKTAAALAFELCWLQEARPRLITGSVPNRFFLLCKESAKTHNVKWCLTVGPQHFSSLRLPAPSSPLSVTNLAAAFHHYV